MQAFVGRCIAGRRRRGGQENAAAGGTAPCGWKARATIFYPLRLGTDNDKRARAETPSAHIALACVPRRGPPALLPAPFYLAGDWACVRSSRCTGHRRPPTPAMPLPLAAAPRAPAGGAMRPGQTRAGLARPGPGRAHAVGPPVGAWPGRTPVAASSSAPASHSGRVPVATPLLRRPPPPRASAGPVPALPRPLLAPRRPANARSAPPGRGLTRRTTTRASAASPARTGPVPRARARLAAARAWFKASPFSSRKFFPMILLCVVAGLGRRGWGREWARRPEWKKAGSRTGGAAIPARAAAGAQAATRTHAAKRTATTSTRTSHHPAPCPHTPPSVPPPSVPPSSHQLLLHVLQ